MGDRARPPTKHTNSCGRSIASALGLAAAEKLRVCSEKEKVQSTPMATTCVVRTLFGCSVPHRGAQQVGDSPRFRRRNLGYPGPLPFSAWFLHIHRGRKMHQDNKRVRRSSTHITAGKGAEKRNTTKKQDEKKHWRARNSLIGQRTCGGISKFASRQRLEGRQGYTPFAATTGGKSTPLHAAPTKPPETHQLFPLGATLANSKDDTHRSIHPKTKSTHTRNSRTCRAGERRADLNPNLPSDILNPKHTSHAEFTHISGRRTASWPYPQPHPDLAHRLATRQGGGWLGIPESS